MYTLPRTGRTIERPSRAPVYRLRATQQAPTVTPATPRPASIDYSGVRRGTAQHEALIRERLQQQRQPRTQRASRAFILNAPALNLPTLARLSLLVADEARMPGFFGTIALQCDPASVDLSRVKSGLLSLCLDHDPTKPAGRIVHASIDGAVLYAVGEVADVPDGREYLESIDNGLRLGVSPGFIISGFELQEDGDNLHTKVTSWQPYEISATAIPRKRLSTHNWEGIHERTSDPGTGFDFGRCWTRTRLHSSSLADRARNRAPTPSDAGIRQRL